MLDYSRVRRAGSVLGLGLGVVGIFALAVGFAWGRGEATGEKVTPLLASSETILGEPIQYPAGAQAKVTAAVVALDPGAETGWHTHGVPLFG